MVDPSLPPLLFMLLDVSISLPPLHLSTFLFFLRSDFPRTQFWMGSLRSWVYIRPVVSTTNRCVCVCFLYLHTWWLNTSVFRRRCVSVSHEFVHSCELVLLGASLYFYNHLKVCLRGGCSHTHTHCQRYNCMKKR